MSGFKFENIRSAALVDSYRETCGQLGGNFSKFLQPDGTYTVVCEVSARNESTPIRRGDGAALAAGRLIEIDGTALDALARVAQSEVGHFGQYGAAQLSGGLAAVVDTILNRVAHSSYPNSVEDVVNQPSQFSAVNAPGSWTGLPAASSAIMGIVREHVAERAAGVASAIWGATHFLNPYLSSATALASWGNYVKANPVAVYGSDANQDVHYHGFPPQRVAARRLYSVVPWHRF